MHLRFRPPLVLTMLSMHVRLNSSLAYLGADVVFFWPLAVRSYAASCSLCWALVSNHKKVVPSHMFPGAAAGKSRAHEVLCNACMVR